MANTLVLPTVIRLGKKNYSLNMNGYRNWHYHTSNRLKQEFQWMVEPMLKGLKVEGPIMMSYIYYAKDKRKFDVGNIHFVVDKFFCDSLVHFGVIEDDNYTIVTGAEYFFGGVDRDNGPYAQVTINPYIGNIK